MGEKTGVLTRTSCSTTKQLKILAVHLRWTAHGLGQLELYLTVREILFPVQLQMVCYRKTTAVLAVSALQVVD